MECQTANSSETADAAQAACQEKPRQRRMAREPQSTTNSATDGAAPTNSAKASASPRARSKIAQVIALLEAPRGTSLDAMVDATGWLPHTTRAALTGLKQKGHVIEKSTVDGVTHYSITKVAAQ
jgi:Protein of unknown function (DUF3489)